MPSSQSWCAPGPTPLGAHLSSYSGSSPLSVSDSASSLTSGTVHRLHALLWRIRRLVQLATVRASRSRYSEPMLAQATVALHAAVPDSQQHSRDLTQHDIVTVQGEGDTWAEAKAACEIPDGALLLAWRRSD